MIASDVIRNHIEKNGIRQKFVAEKAGISPELLRRSLYGNRKIPADEFLRICWVLSLDFSDFINTKKETK